MDGDVQARLMELERRVATLELYVRGMPGGAALPASSAAPTDAGADSDVLGLLEAGQEIDAIKLWRQKTGLGLAEAKQAIDTLKAQRGY